MTAGGDLVDRVVLQTPSGEAVEEAASARGRTTPALTVRQDVLCDILEAALPAGSVLFDHSLRDFSAGAGTERGVFAVVDRRDLGQARARRKRVQPIGGRWAQSEGQRRLQMRAAGARLRPDCAVKRNAHAQSHTLSPSPPPHPAARGLQR